MTKEDYEKNGVVYGYLLDYLENNDLDSDTILQYHYLNEWFATIQV
jgi:glutathione-regulated potassium-efflux system ancillary protein KefG